MPDPNFPGMRVCKDDLDQYDPWRLPAIKTENIALRFPRPDVSIALQPDHVITENGFMNGNSILIEGVPPAGGSTGDLNTQSGPSNSLRPLITAVSPNQGSTAGGTTVLITGNNFTDAMTIKFGSQNVTSVEILSPYQMWVTSPPNTSVGAVSVSVLSTYGNAVSPGAFTYI
jgi:hypothetical protein